LNRAAFAGVCAAALAAMAIAPSWAAAAPGSVTDDTQADFAAGTPGAATEVVAPGSVRLARVREEFDGAALPAGFSSTPWTPGGDATVAGGALAVDGTLVSAGPAASAPRSLEFRATFGAAPFENIGYGTDFNRGPWAMFSTGGGPLGSGLFARVATGAAGLTDVAIPDVDPALPHTYRIDWTAGAVSFYVDGALVDTEPAVITADMRPLISDFAADGSGETVDWMTGDAYTASGAFLSRVLDAGDARAAWGALAADGDASVTFATRSGDTATPDASWSGFQALGPAGEIRSPRGRYLQYRATLTTADPTVSPSLDRVDAGFDVDTVSPAVSIAGVDVAGTAATVRFSSSAADVVRYECRLDGGAYAACSSPRRYTGLADGPHTVAVRAIDAAGNVGASAVRGFVVDVTAPRVTIAGVQVAGGAATVRFASPDGDVARFECRLDGASFAACASPHGYAGLAPGAHAVYVRAVDARGNVGAAASRGFAVAPAPSSPTQPPVVNRAPAVRLTTSRTRASHTGVVTLNVACSAGATPCRLTLRLQRGGRRLAQRTVTVAAGTSHAVRLRLSRADRRLLAHAHRLKLTEMVSVGGRQVAHRRLTLLAPRR
jgi:hypothetical protein